MTAHSIFEDGPCRVVVTTVGNLDNDLGFIAAGGSATFTDPNDGGKTLTLSVDVNGVVALTRMDEWGVVAFPDGYLIKVFPPLVYGSSDVWIENIRVRAIQPAGFGGLSAAYAFANDGVITLTGNPALTVAADDTCTPDPTPVVHGMPTGAAYELHARVSVA